MTVSEKIHSASPMIKIRIEGNTVILGRDGSQITFDFLDGLPANREQWGLVGQIYRIVLQMNVMVSWPVSHLAIRKSMLESSTPLNEFEFIIIHEIAHHLFRQIANKKEINRIFALSLGSNLFEFLNKTISSQPHESPEELFASFCLVYFTHPEELLLSIPDESRRLTIALWCFLRDHIFKGLAFSNKDPFAEEKTQTALIYFDSENEATSLLSALKNKNPYIRAAAFLYIKNNPPSDQRLLSAAQEYENRAHITHSLAR